MRTQMLALALLLSGLVLSPVGNASEFDKKTILTFPRQVQVPGAVLDPGTYVIKRTNPGGNPDIVSFLSRDEMHVYATAKAIPTERPEPADKPVIMFAETRSGHPEALKKWYYPGDLTGEEFVYPKDQEVLIARATELQRDRSAEVSDSGVVAAPAPETRSSEMMEQNTDTSSSAVMNQEPVETAQNTAPAPPSSTAESSATTTTTESESTATSQSQSEMTTDPNAATALPDTASNVPLLGLIGGSALLLGLGLRKLVKQNS
ncbi:MAG: hypothetical protein HYX72_11440 [Acidobacteria bacterium]|nr:hypothetical protein [Acidobacteriota bacterium]